MGLNIQSGHFKRPPLLYVLEILWTADDEVDFLSDFFFSFFPDYLFIFSFSLLDHSHLQMRKRAFSPHCLPVIVNAAFTVLAVGCCVYFLHSIYISSKRQQFLVTVD